MVGVGVVGSLVVLPASLRLFGPTSVGERPFERQAARSACSPRRRGVVDERRPRRLLRVGASCGETTPAGNDPARSCDPTPRELDAREIRNEFAWPRTELSERPDCGDELRHAPDGSVRLQGEQQRVADRARRHARDDGEPRRQFVHDEEISDFVMCALVVVDNCSC